MNKIVNVSPNINPATCFLKEPDYLYVSDIDEPAYKKFKEDFNRVLNANRTVVPIVVDSYGGYVDSLFGMLSIIQSSPVPVVTILETKAMSCGAVLFSAGTKGMRYIAPLGHLMIHQVSLTEGEESKLAEMKVSVDHTETLNKQLLQILDKNCGKKEGYFDSEIERRKNTDWYVTSREAKRMGIADHIRMPQMRVLVHQFVEIS